MEQLRDVFTTDAQAVYVLSPLGLEDVHLSGVDEIIGWLDSVLGNLGEPAPRHAMTNHLVEIDGDRGAVAELHGQRHRSLHRRARAHARRLARADVGDAQLPPTGVTLTGAGPVSARWFEQRGEHRGRVRVAVVLEPGEPFVDRGRGGPEAAGELRVLERARDLLHLPANATHAAVCSA